VLFDRICRDNGIIHRLTRPRHPTTTGKVERFHGSLRRELLNDNVPFADLAAAQAAVDTWASGYNTTRPHQSLDMASPAEALGQTSVTVDAVSRAERPPRLLLTVEEAAERIGICRSNMFKLIRRGEIQSVRVGRLRRVTPDALEDFVRRLSAEEDPAA
jgi:excisionase family DNA binding protein